MKISYNWLAQYVDLPPADELARRLTMAGLEVEGIERPGEALKGVVVAQILESNKHPNADKLSVTKIDSGTGTPLQVVCGAKNYKVGDKVPLATVGTKLPDGTEIKASALRGVDSFGMLCSSRELALSEESSGLLILDAQAKVGQPIAQALGLDDTVLELNVTPNRPDALSHLGVAREVATLLGRPLKLPAVTLNESGASASEKIAVRIEDDVRCPRYAARVIEGVKVGPSPAWMQQRLKSCGVRAINNLVDITNYVMLETGQPLHAFDLDQVAGGQIIVRLPKSGEKLVTLDGKERALHAEDLLVCDRDQAQVLAGVMGGAKSEVTPGTTRVLLECAHFQPATVRRASKRHALHTESSHRFERGTDVTNIPWVIDRAAALIAELGGGTVLKGRVDVQPKVTAPTLVTLRATRVAAVLGSPVSVEESHRILQTLGFKVTEAVAGQTTYEVPGARVDVTCEEDLIEEIARIRGYDAIAPALPKGAGVLKPWSTAYSVERRVRSAMSGAGMNEVVNYSFVSPEELKAFNAEQGAIALSNPLSVEMSVMRTTLLAGLVGNVNRSVRHQATGVRFYELGRTYRPNPQGGKQRAPVAIEEWQLAGALWGIRDGVKSWTGKDAANDFYDAKGVVTALLESLGIEHARYEPLENDWYHPRAAATVRLGERVLGTLGELHPKPAKKLDAPAGVFLFQLNMEALIAEAVLVPKAAPLSKFPSVLRDVAFKVDATLPNAEVRKLILEVGAPLLTEATIFDVYTGNQIEAGRKNVAYALTYQAADRTLTDAEVSAAHQRIVAEVTQRLGGTLRA